MKKAFKVGVIVVLALAVAWTFATLLNMLGEVESSRLDRAELHERLDRQRTTADTLADQIRDLGHDPVVDPGTTPEARYMPVPGRDGKDGRDGRDGDSITGQPGRDGESIVGPPGRDGKTVVGPPGADSTVPGPPGKGEKGDKGDPSTVPGPRGGEGPPGRGIESMSCVGPRITFTITWTDGTTSEVQCGR